MTNIVTITANNYCHSVFDGTHATPKPCPNGYKLITSKNITGDGINISDAYFISEQDYFEINKRSKVYQWDILFSMIGTVGNLYLEENSDIDYAIKNIGVFSCRDEFKAKWLFYYLQSPMAKNHIKRFLNGAVQKFLSLKQLRDFPILPFEKDKISIVEILSALDKKIALNKQINARLEEMAKTLYDYWFVQFDFPDANGKPYKSSGGEMVFDETLKREIPKGWEVVTLKDFLTIKNGKDHKPLSDGKYTVYGSGGAIRCVDDYLFEGESVLIPRKGTLNNVMYIDEAFWTVDTMFYTEMKQDFFAKYVFYSIKDIDFTKFNLGTGVPSMTSSILYSLKIIKPSNCSLKHFEDVVKPIFLKIANNEKQNHQLTQLRDFLLPMLMNGQVSVTCSGARDG